MRNARIAGTSAATVATKSRRLRATSGLIDDYRFIRLQSYERRKRKFPSVAAFRLVRNGGFDLLYVSDVPLCLLAYAINPATALNWFDRAQP
jgi:hypothetical protein